MYIYIHIYTYIHTHIYKHTHIHTHMAGTLLSNNSLVAHTSGTRQGQAREFTVLKNNLMQVNLQIYQLNSCLVEGEISCSEAVAQR